MNNEKTENKVVLLTFGGSIFSFSGLALAAFLRDKNYVVDIIQCRPSDLSPIKDGEEPSFRHLTDQQLELLGNHCVDALAIGISLVATHYLKQAIQINNYLREKLDIPIIWGGVPVICDPEFYLNYAEYICTCEGEFVFLNFLESIRTGRSPNQVKGIAYLDSAQKAVINQGCDPIGINSLPIPTINPEHFFLLKEALVPLNEDMYSLLDQTLCDGYRIFPVRGCPFSCTYCSNNKLTKQLKGKDKVRISNNDRIIEELIQAKKLLPQMAKVMFYEDDFFVRSEEELEDLIKKYKEHIDLQINVNGTVVNLSEKKIDIIQSHNVKIEFIKIGIQNASIRVNKEIFKRPFKRDEYLKKIPMLLTQKVPVIADMISANPYDTIDDKIESAGFFYELFKALKHLKNPGDYIFFMDHKLMYYPGTELYQKALQDGYIDSNYIEDVLLKRKTTKKAHETDIDKMILIIFKLSLRFKYLSLLLKLLTIKATLLLLFFIFKPILYVYIIIQEYKETGRSDDIATN